MHDLREVGALVKRGLLWSAHHGLRASLDRASAYLVDRRGPSSRSYEKWLRATVPPARRGGALLVSVLVPVRDPPTRYLDALHRSVRAQEHARWELLFVDDGSQDAAVGRRLAALAAGDARVRVLAGPTPGGISAATQVAAAAARGEVLLFADHDDELGRGLLAEVVGAFVRDPSLDMVYSDEDRITSWQSRTEPVFKPGPSPWLALGCNYVTHGLALRRRFFQALGGLRSSYDGAQDHDLVLRAFEQARKIRHLPLIGYHWRRVPGSVAATSTAKPWAFEAGRRAVEEACRRRRLSITNVRHGAIPGVYVLHPGPAARPAACQLVLHGPAAGRRAWLGHLRGLGELVRILGVHDGRWPTAEDPGDWLIVEADSRPWRRSFSRLARWFALAGVGAVAGAVVAGRRRRHLGYSLRRDGLAQPILPGLPVQAGGPSLLAHSPREVATSMGGVLLTRRPPAWLRQSLAGRPVDAAGSLCVALSPAASGQGALLFHPRVVWRALDEVRVRDVQLSDEAAWPALRDALPDGFWDGAADRFCPRHELLTDLGLPSPTQGMRRTTQSSSKSRHTTV